MNPGAKRTADTLETIRRPYGGQLTVTELQAPPPDFVDPT
jgi:hypothetical protein